MNEKTFALLEFDRLREEIGAYCLSPEGRAEFLRRVPSADEAQVEAWKDSARVWNFALDGESPPPFRSWPEVLPVFAVLRAEGAVLAAEELTALGDFCRAAESMRRWGQENAPDRAAAPEGPESVMPESADPVPSGEKSRRKETLALFQTAAELPDLSAACSAVSSVFEPDGTFRELPRLAAIRAEITAIRRDIEKRTARFFSNPALASMLQSLLPALRNGRQVLAVKANFRGRIRGIVHEVSQTGQTVYVEPEEIVERNNDLIAEEFRLSREMAEIRRELTESLRGYCPAFQDAFRCMTVFDGLHAAALWGRKRGCVFARLPSASGDSGEFFLRLVRARHPFLRGEVVPVDLSIPRNTRAVILTGPNTGGKTVTLKTAALFALANQCGWPVPAAEGTLLPVFDFVGCDIGDDQSIEQSLSTFSAHMKTVSGFFAHAGERSLILLDEFGSGTDPQEGAAIAMAVLDALLQRGSLLLITTHHGAIKHYGYSHAGCVNASVEFNAETLSPTYRILMGIPGESRALDIAARNGLPPEILAAARAYLAGGDADVSALIQGLTEKHRELRGLEDRLHTEEAALQKTRQETEQRALRVRQQELALREQAFRQEKAFFLENRRRLENLVREVREGRISKETTAAVKRWAADEEQELDKEYGEIQHARAVLAAGTDPAAEGKPAFSGISGTEKADSGIAPGAEVLVAPGGVRGTVLRRGKKNMWIVETGAVRISVPENALTAVSGKAAHQPKIPAASVEVQNAEESARPVFELRLLGMRRAEAEKALIRQLDLAVISGFKEFSVVHGKGNGVLQSAVISVLKDYPEVEDFRFALPENGGTGKTIVRMR